MGTAVKVKWKICSFDIKSQLVMNYEREVKTLEG
jgi:hypothetical protein